MVATWFDVAERNAALDHFPFLRRFIHLFGGNAWSLSQRWIIIRNGGVLLFSLPISFELAATRAFILGCCEKKEDVANTITLIMFNMLWCYTQEGPPEQIQVKSIR